jgi:uncharacterized RDD family membrane protein YckC
MLPGSHVALDNTADVDTPEHVRFRYRLAGPARRGLAYLIDLLIRLAALLVVGIVMSLAFGARAEQAAQASGGVVMVIAFLLEWGYYVLLESTGGGASPGKRALGLRVIKEGGFPIGFLDSVLRNLLRAADFLPVGYVLGLLSMAGDSRFRRLGDRVAGTMVVIEERSSLGSALVLHPPARPGELEQLPQRPPLSAWERETLELFLRRRDLAAARRAELAETVAPLLARRLGVRVTDPERLLALVHHRAVAAARAGERR